MKESTKIYHYLPQRATFEIAINDSKVDSVNISHTYIRSARGESDALFKHNRELDKAKNISEEYSEEIKRLQEELPTPFREVSKLKRFDSMITLQLVDEK